MEYILLVVLVFGFLFVGVVVGWTGNHLGNKIDNLVEEAINLKTTLADSNLFE